MKSFLAEQFEPNKIEMDYKSGNTRIIIAADSISANEEQAEIKKRLGRIMYDAAEKNFYFSIDK